MSFPALHSTIGGVELGDPENQGSALTRRSFNSHSYLIHSHAVITNSALPFSALTFKFSSQNCLFQSMVSKASLSKSH